jgi:drug/metabolite transporter (DMT)-like permease
MPLTFRMLEAPNDGLWIAIRVVLAVVGVASVGLIGSLLFLKPRQPAWAYVLAILGSVAFAVQTALLDAIVWPKYFPA